MESMTLNLGNYARFGDQHFEDAAYVQLDKLVTLKGFANRDEATDYYIAWLEN